MNIKIFFGFVMVLILSGCVLFYPARIVMPLNTRIVDSESGNPIEGAQVLRIVCDVHDFDCSNGKIDKVQSDSNGIVKAVGSREWGLYAPAPGGFPVPNHQIAIWKEGYYVFIFSQYGSIENVKKHTKRQDIINAINAIPIDRKEYNSTDRPEEMFSGGIVKLYKLGK